MSARPTMSAVFFSMCCVVEGSTVGLAHACVGVRIDLLVFSIVMIISFCVGTHSGCVVLRSNIWFLSRQDDFVVVTSEPPDS